MTKCLPCSPPCYDQLVAVAIVPTGAEAVACSVSPIRSVKMTKYLPCPDRRPATIDSLLLPSFRPVPML
eukprot:scaffold81743_cov23-Attheya_sp.AAC.1